MVIMAVRVASVVIITGEATQSFPPSGPGNDGTVRGGLETDVGSSM